ncbi:hypothetical protein NXH67_10455 [Butyrivibrio sp. DSM 10294]|uniref:hypothetical protein n=1 Tax=Butyrivibrio sp. DSM 10294 TaxID=2972457 RepID=UPI00234E9BB1|nr:hypothetical protein [Butyrivibrio sp. DSM 10294]MDC7293935.1 hypothetical protein [Butyrivibrio sp. DSM 10294]
MKKRLLAALLVTFLFTSSVLVSFADDKNDAETNAPELTYTTGTQERAEENAVDVDEDIRQQINDTIPGEMEEISISSADELMELARSCSLDTWSVNKKVILTKDISLLGKDFDGIPSFGGIFDGQGHTVSEVNIDRGLSYAGFFVYVQKTALIQNLKITGIVQPEGNSTIVGGIAGDNCGRLNACSFKGIVRGNDYIGGIAGINELSGTISSGISEGFISGKHFIGGITGENYGNLSNCRNEALVNTTNTDTEITIDSLEGLNKVLNFAKDGFKQDKEEAKGDVTVSDIGGIAGLSIGIISHCINNADVGYDHVGYNIGGIAGRQSGYVIRCSNNGTVKGRKDVGGIVGQAEPYLTVDLSSDVAYQLEQAVSKLHDSVTVTLNDAKNESNIVSNRLAVIQRFTAGAVSDTRYLADGAIDFANGVASGATEAFSRIDYILEESSQNGGPIDNIDSGVGNIKSTAEDVKDAVGHLDIEEYIKDEDELKQYREAKLVLESAKAQYKALYNQSERTYYNLAIRDNRLEKESTSDLVYVDSSGNAATDYSAWGEGNIGSGLNADAPGSWQHKEGVTFPIKDNDDDSELDALATAIAASNCDEYARANYVNPVTGTKGTYTDDVASKTSTILGIYEKHLPEMGKSVRSDAQEAMNHLEDASDNFRTAGSQTKNIIGNIAAKDSITFPQFSSEYKAHTASLADNMQGMNDNFGILNQEVNNAGGVLIDDLLDISDQFNNILELYTDAIDGVLEKDYTNLITDASYEAAANTTDATIDSCFNYGECKGDLDTSGIAGTMAIEYDFDRESDLTGNKDNLLNSSYITRCVLRDNRNYGDIIALKNYSGGICGLQEMGTILNCGSYAKVISTSGNYVGGVAGSSIAHIVRSYAKGELDGNTYVGGIAGNGKHIKECLAIVTVGEATDWYGAVAGHIEESGEVRDNYFVSDDLSGIDRVSYALKAEPVSYDSVSQNKVFKELEEETEEKESEIKEAGTGEASDTEPMIQYRELPYEFSNLTVNFILEDDDLDSGKEKIGQISKKYGDSINEDEYPAVDEKDGFYIEWDRDRVERITCDTTITAHYKRFRTTLAEKSEDDDFHQSELLVDGAFREEDELEVERTLNYKAGDTAEDVQYNFETLKVKIPTDGNNIHMIRFRLNNALGELTRRLPGIFGEQHLLYLVNGDERIPIEKTGTMGGYYTYEIEGNEFVLSVGVPNTNRVYYLTIAIIIGVLLLILVIIIVVIVNIHRHGRKLPGALKELKSNVSEKIESKEQLFYDDSQDDLFRKELKEYKEMLEKDGLNKEHSDEASESAQEIKEEKTEHSKNDKSKRKKKSKK